MLFLRVEIPIRSENLDTIAGGITNSNLSNAYKTMLNGRRYLEFTNDVGIITLEQLTPKMPYLVQIWFQQCDATNDPTMYIGNIGDEVSNCKALCLNTDGTPHGLGQYIKGTFIATNDTQSFLIYGSYGRQGQFNAIQVRTVPSTAVTWIGTADSTAWDTTGTHWDGHTAAETLWDRYSYGAVFTNENATAVLGADLYARSLSVSTGISLSGGYTLNLYNSATIDSGSGASTIASALVMNGGTLTKNGTGSLTISGANTIPAYLVNNGSLTISGSPAASSA